MDKIRVVCQNIRNNYPEQIKVGEEYLVDIENAFGDEEGWYAPIYDLSGNEVGNSLNLNHFRRIT